MTNRKLREKDSAWHCKSWGSWVMRVEEKGKSMLGYRDSLTVWHEGTSLFGVTHLAHCLPTFTMGISLLPFFILPGFGEG
jgi:hypothetical protein